MMITLFRCILQIFKCTYYTGTFNLTCNAPSCRDDESEIGRDQVFVSYLYFLLKILDLLDTVSLECPVFVASPHKTN